MKRRLIPVLVVALALAFATGALTPKAQAAAFPPKNLCVYQNSYGDYLNLYIKSMGNVKTSEGNVKMYAINGNYAWFDDSVSFPVAGTGYWSWYYGFFHFSVPGPSTTALTS